MGILAAFLKMIIQIASLRKLRISQILAPCTTKIRNFREIRRGLLQNPKKQRGRPAARIPSLAASAIPPLASSASPLGSDGVPAPYHQASQAFLSQCPLSVWPIVWEATIYDAALLFGDFGQELVRLDWHASGLFAVPHDGGQGGLVWFIKGSPAVCIGRDVAFTQDGRRTSALSSSPRARARRPRPRILTTICRYGEAL